MEKIISSASQYDERKKLSFEKWEKFIALKSRIKLKRTPLN
jgi:hypothetical protein